MLKIHLTLPMVIGYLRAIASAEPERVGTINGSGSGTCVYGTYEDNALVPVCIVGQMFANFGLLRLLMTSPNDFNSDAMPVTCMVGGEFWKRLAEFGITVDEDAQRFAIFVQRQQDDGQPWGEAFTNGCEEFRSHCREALDDELNILFR